jgi:hypothetical protein
MSRIADVEDPQSGPEVGAGDDRRVVQPVGAALMEVVEEKRPDRRPERVALGESRLLRFPVGGFLGAVCGVVHAGLDAGDLEGLGRVGHIKNLRIPPRNGQVMDVVDLVRVELKSVVVIPDEQPSACVHSQ